MRCRFIVVATAMSAAMLAVEYGSATAACFSFPSFNAVYAASDEAEAKRIHDLIPSELSFRGRLGRVDRVIVVPGVTETIRVAADPVCKSRPLVVEVAAGKDTESNAFTAFIASRDTKGKLLRATVYKNDCPNWLSTMSGQAGVFRCASTPLRVAKTSKGAPMVELPLEKSAKDGMERLSVVVMGSADSAKLSAATLMIAADGDTCVRLAATREAFTKEFNGFVCVDTIYRDYGLGAVCDADSEKDWAVRVTDVDYASCEIVAFNGDNDFGKHCTINESGEAPNCGNDPGLISVYATTCGALAVPFDYAAIRRLDKGRRLSGNTPVSRDAALDSGPIFLPGGVYGDEFLGSMMTGGKSTNHRKTDIGTDDSKGPRVMHITGTVQKDATASTVLVYPRIQVSVVCKDGGVDPKNNEACQCFYSTGGRTEVGCVVATETDKKDKCKPLSAAADKCAVLDSEHIGYYACEAVGANYPYVGLPCTRHEHCGDGGKCAPTTVCVAENTAWKEGWTPPNNPKPCRRDGSSTTGCGEGRQCGLSLFDFTSRSTIAYDLPSTGQGTQAGFCGDVSGAWCDADSDCAQGVSCIGYRLSAGKHTDN